MSMVCCSISSKVIATPPLLDATYETTSWYETVYMPWRSAAQRPLERRIVPELLWRRRRREYVHRIWVTSYTGGRRKTMGKSREHRKIKHRTAQETVDTPW
jgi:hypothetical protein